MMKKVVGEILRPFAQYHACNKDLQGNIVAIVDGTGCVMVEYNYDAWGRNTCIDASTMNLGMLNPFRYRGYYYDEETGLYFLKTRYYDPEIGRFISIDGIEYLDPESINGLNLYAYCNNNPVMYIDPNGNKWWRWSKGRVNLKHISYLKLIDKVSALVDWSSSFVNPIRTISYIHYNRNLWDLMRLDGIIELPGTWSKVATTLGWGVGIVGGVIAGYQKYDSGASFSSAFAGALISSSINIGEMYVATGIASLAMGIMATVGIPGGVVLVGGALIAIGVGYGIDYFFTELKIFGNTIEGHLNNFIDWLIFWD